MSKVSVRGLSVTLQEVIRLEFGKHTSKGGSITSAKSREVIFVCSGPNLEHGTDLIVKISLNTNRI